MCQIARRLLFAALLVFPILSAHAEERLTNSDVVKLVQAGLSEETIAAKIAASESAFDTSTDALVALKGSGVPDSVIRRMIERAAVPMTAARVKPATVVSVAAPAAKVSDSHPAAVKTVKTKRFDVTLHRPAGGKCDGAELKVDAKGVHATRCRDLDFDLSWDAITGLCYDYSFRGGITFMAGDERHVLSLTTPMEAKKIVDIVREALPSITAQECRR
jgi:hypothetical protein